MSPQNEWVAQPPKGWKPGKAYATARGEGPIGMGGPRTYLRPRRFHLKAQRLKFPKINCFPVADPIYLLLKRRFARRLNLGMCKIDSSNSFFVAGVQAKDASAACPSRT